MLTVHYAKVGCYSSEVDTKEAQTVSWVKFWAKIQYFNVKKVWVFFYLGPFTKRPLKVQIIHLKTRNVSPLACPYHQLPMNRRLGIIAGRVRCLLCFRDEYDDVYVLETI